LKKQPLALVGFVAVNHKQTCHYEKSGYGHHQQYGFQNLFHLFLLKALFAQIYSHIGHNSNKSHRHNTDIVSLEFCK
jgi:hypothetical protein